MTETIKIGEKKVFERIITEGDVRKFADLTGDHNPLHVDPEYAGSTQFGKCIPHGMLVGSLFSTLVGMHLPGKKCLYLSQKLNFKRPAPIGQPVQVTGEVVNKIDALDILVISTKIIDKNGAILIEGEAKVKVI